jgi:hypothetical protein
LNDELHIKQTVVVCGQENGMNNGFDLKEFRGLKQLGDLGNS